MMLFNLSLKNIKKSFKDYAIYFFTLILGVAIFYVFNAIETQTVMMNVSASTYDIIDLMIQMLSGVSVFVSFILGFLIIYASRFLIKRRNKEFGVYLTLGMSKRKISMILFFETLLIGVISLVLGLLLGTVLSQFMSLLVANMFEADMTSFKFIFSTSACIKTLIYFGVMYLLVMIFNTINVNKCKLIDLIHGSKKSEKIKLKNPVICTIVFIIFAGILGYCYYRVGFKGGSINDEEIYRIIIAGCISTFFIFWSLSGLLLKIFMSMKKFYYKGLNSFTLRQISSKINTTVFSMSIICLMLFVTICVLSSSLSIKSSVTKNLNELAPVDMEVTKFVEGNKESIASDLNNSSFDTDKNLKDVVEINYYGTSNFTLEDFLGDYLDELLVKYPYLNYQYGEDIVKVSDYNKVASLYGNKTYELSDNEFLVVADFDSMVSIRNEALKEDDTIEIKGVTLKAKYDECLDGFIKMASNHTNTGLIIVPDSINLEDNIMYKVLLANYNASSKDEKEVIEEKLDAFMDSTYEYNYYGYDYSTKMDIVDSSVGLGALITFIGLYLGIIFLISSAAILALKELSESSDNRDRFEMIRRLGADEKMINKALFRQIAIFFMFPLLIAIIHSVFGIMFCSNILAMFGKGELLPSIVLASVFLIVIYGGYFLITYFCSKNIIKERL